MCTGCVIVIHCPYICFVFSFFAVPLRPKVSSSSSRSLTSSCESFSFSSFLSFDDLYFFFYLTVLILFVSSWLSDLLSSVLSSLGPSRPRPWGVARLTSRWCFHAASLPSVCCFYLSITSFALLLSVWFSSVSSFFFFFFALSFSVLFLF